MNNLIYLMELTQDVCSSSEVKQILGLVGIVIFVLKILIPVILIIIGSVEMFKAISSDDADAISKAGGKLGKKVIAAILVFLVPTIVGLLMSLIGASSWEGCKQCLISNPWSSDCRINVGN